MIPSLPLPTNRRHLTSRHQQGPKSPRTADAQQATRCMTPRCHMLRKSSTSRHAWEHVPLTCTWHAIIDPVHCRLLQRPLNIVYDLSALPRTQLSRAILVDAFILQTPSPTARCLSLSKPLLCYGCTLPLVCQQAISTPGTLSDLYYRYQYLLFTRKQKSYLFIPS